MTSYMINHSKLITKAKKTKILSTGLPDNGFFRKWHPLKQTKTKIWHQFLRPTFYE